MIIEIREEDIGIKSGVLREILRHHAISKEPGYIYHSSLVITLEQMFRHSGEINKQVGYIRRYLSSVEFARYNASRLP